MPNIKSLFARMNPTTRAALEGAVGKCVSAGHYSVEIEHFLDALLAPGNEIWQSALHFKINLDRVKAELRLKLLGMRSGNKRTPDLSPQLISLITEAWLAASLELGATQISSGAVLLGLLNREMALRWRDSAPELFRIPVEGLAAALLEISSQSTEGSSLAPGDVDPPKVFLSYRRSDTETMAEVLFWCLMAKVDGIRLFRDKDTLQPGMVFAEVIDQSIANCDVLVVLIGKDWLTARDKDGRQRLNDEADWVRLEVASALRQKKKIFPCLIDGAQMPSGHELPADLQGMAAYNATSISLSDVSRDVESLVQALKRASR